MTKNRKLMPPVHPGEILLEDSMKPLRLSVSKLALDLHVSRHAHRRNCPSAPAHQCRHGAPAGLVFQN